MSVYVDDLQPTLKNQQWKYNKGCHLFADSEYELLKFADKMGLKRSWIQRNKRLIHFDLTENMRKLAIKMGAMPVDREFIYERIRQAKNENTM